MDEVEDEVKEGVWGYLFPLDTRYGGRCIVLKKRTLCPDANDVKKAIGPKAKGKCVKNQEEAYEKSKIKGVPSGGYLIGRHPECGKTDRCVGHPQPTNPAFVHRCYYR